jgi:hypothetical protein
MLSFPEICMDMFLQSTQPPTAIPFRILLPALELFAESARECRNSYWITLRPYDAYRHLLIVSQVLSQNNPVSPPQRRALQCNTSELTSDFSEGWQSGEETIKAPTLVYHCAEVTRIKYFCFW